MATLPYLIIGVFLLLHVLSIKHEKLLLIPIIISYLLFIIGFGAKCLEHYQIVMIPLYACSVVSFDFQRKWLKKLLLGLMITVMLAFLVRPFGFLLFEVVAGNDRFAAVNADFHDIVKMIPEAELDSIYNYNTDLAGCGLLYSAKLLQCNKVLYPTLSFMLKTLGNDRKHMEDERPLWIMIYQGMVIPSEMYYIQENYEQRFVLHYDTKYLKNIQGFGIEKDIYFFRRK
ncbi:MAG: hypothetical protein J5708_04365 [Bacteroidales bacterium]|nr:hypothetical protein [Bacteroidales bacterium]